MSRDTIGLVDPDFGDPVPAQIKRCDGDHCDNDDAEDVQLAMLPEGGWLDLCAVCRKEYRKAYERHAAWESAGDDAYDRMKDDKLTGGGR